MQSALYSRLGHECMVRAGMHCRPVHDWNIGAARCCSCTGRWIRKSAGFGCCSLLGSSLWIVMLLLVMLSVLLMLCPCPGAYLWNWPLPLAPADDLQLVKADPPRRLLPPDRAPKGTRKGTGIAAAAATTGNERQKVGNVVVIGYTQHVVSYLGRCPEHHR